MASYYPPVGFHFLVQFDLSDSGEQDVLFQEVTGINMELETETFNEGGENRFAYKLPLRTNYPDLVLKRGLLVHSGLRKWVEEAIQDFKIQPIQVWVKLLNEEHEPLQTYTFINAYPKKWVLSDFNAQNSGILIETLELSYQYFKINN